MKLWINEVYKHHKEWLNIVKSFGEAEYAEDLVQEMYICLHKYTDVNQIFKDGELTKRGHSYIYRILLNLFRQLHRKRKQLPKVNLDEVDLMTDEDDEERAVLDIICQKVEQEVAEWNLEEGSIFLDKFINGTSYRKLGKKLDKHFTTVYFEFRETLEKIKEAVGEDYEDYLNGDYNYI